ncbi:ABC transporter permease [Gordonia sp. LSe1-13]|uniref:ABC transporter permease n=1 Tax=Gordonia sesuvii TaxID=3116777 RepID=A0ABU7MAC7_9ACTN|nr:ABC transporter permease [Gordonia sp. LSe1-13]
MAIGVTVVLGVLVLRSDLVRPFDAFGPSLTAAADDGVVEVIPDVSGRLPTTTVDRLRAEVSGAQAIVPFVATLTPVGTGDNTQGFFLLGGSCDIELLIGDFGCATRARDAVDFHRPGVPMQMAAPVAAELGLSVGDDLALPGLPPGSAYLAATFDDVDRVESINDGYVLVAPSAAVAAELLSIPGFVTAAFVVPRPGDDIEHDVDRAIADTATAVAPRAQLPAVFENGRQSLDLIALAGIIVGVLVSVNTVLLAVEDRRTVMATILAIGARPTGVLAGMLGEGAVVGVLGGLLGVPTGFGLGTFLVDTFGTSMVAGSGGTISAHFEPRLLAVGAAAGITCGVLAMLAPAFTLLRNGPLASMATAGGVPRARSVPVWPLVVGVCLLAGAAAVMTIFAGGALPLTMGVNGLTIALCGIVLATVWIAPRVAQGAAQAVTSVRPDIGRLLGADLRRYVMLFGLSAALLTEATSLAIGSQSMQLLGAEQVAAQKSDRLPSALMLTAQSVFDQRDGVIADATAAAVTRTAAGHPVASRWRATISSGASTRLVFGVTPGDWYSRAQYEPTTDADALWDRLHRGEVALTEQAATRLGVQQGDLVTLPTVWGRQDFRVAGTVRSAMLNDAAVADIVLVNQSVARTQWAAARDQMAVQYPSPVDAATHRSNYLELDAGLWVFDNEHWRAESAAGITRFLRPFTLAGFVVMVAAGLSVLNVFVLGLIQRRRERAVLRAVGVTTGQERAVVMSHAAVLGLVVGGLAILGGMGVTYLWSLGSGVFYGTPISWGVPVAALGTGLVGVAVIVMAAATYPVVYVGRLETSEVLRGN